MANYVICPRCELNFIDEDEQEFCDVCLKELSGEKLLADDFEEEIDEEMELCPVCGENHMRLGEKMCEECRMKADYDDEAAAEAENEDAWRSYLDDDDTTDDLDIPLSEGDFEDDEEEEETEEETSVEDEWETVTADDYDDDYDDDDDDDDDDDF